MTATDVPRAGRRLALPAWIGLVISYLVIIQGLGLLIGVDTGDRQFPTTESLIRNALIPIGASLVFAVVLATWLGWWEAIVHSRFPVRRWVWFVPILMISVAVVSVNYGRLADQTAEFVLCLVLLAVFVGFTEELMFRGIGVNVLRELGWSEGRVALWSSVIFGLVHVSNGISEGPQAILQAAIVATSGYFFYLTLRVGGVIFLPMLVHGLWDFSLISSLAGEPEPEGYFGTVLVILAQVVLIVVVLARRNKIEPEESGRRESNPP